MVYQLGESGVSQVVLIYNNLSIRVTLTSVALYHTYMYMYIMYIYIYMLYGIQDPGPWIHVTVYTDPCPVPLWQGRGWIVEPKV